MKTTEQSKQAIQDFKKSFIRYPDHKITNINTDESKRDPDFCVFIMTYGRADNVKTYKTLMEYENTSFNQDLYFICSDDDKHLQDYIDKFGDRVLVFSKKKMIPYLDKGDIFDRYGVILYARNICFSFASQLGYRYFVELDDDYDIFSQRIYYSDYYNIKGTLISDMKEYPEYIPSEDEKKCEGKLMMKKILDYDYLFRVHLDFLKSTPCKTITMSQHGDYIGGVGNTNAKRGWQRKVMNSFFCDIEDPFTFNGSINEDVNYYTESGRMGNLNFNLFFFALNQESTQQSSGGMTEGYLDGGTYLKSFYTVLYTPSAAKIGYIGCGDNKRMHHKINANYCYPKIIDEKYTKETDDEGILDDF